MQRDDYHSFLIRMWRRGQTGVPDWLLIVENPHTGERHHFDDISALVTFLKQVMTLDQEGDKSSAQLD